MLSRKHYNQIAAMFKDILLDTESDEVYDQFEEMAGRMAVMFKEDNPNFDRHRFIKACGL